MLACEHLLSQLDPGSSPGRADPLRGLFPLLDDRRYRAGAYRSHYRARIKPWLLCCFHSTHACLLLLDHCMQLTACVLCACLLDIASRLQEQQSRLLGPKFKSGLFPEFRNYCSRRCTLVVQCRDLRCRGRARSGRIRVVRMSCEEARMARFSSYIDAKKHHHPSP